MDEPKALQASEPTAPPPEATAPDTAPQAPGTAPTLAPNANQMFSPTVPPPGERGMGDPIVQPIEAQRSWFTSFAGILVDSSMAYTTNPTMQSMMREDTSLMSAYFAVQMDIATTEWDIEPQDPDDDDQVEYALQLREDIASIPKLTDMLMCLSECLWYGCGPINHMITWCDVRKRYVITNWLPIHPDSMVATREGGFGIKVGAAYTTQAQGAQQSVPGFQSRVHLLSDVEREAITLPVSRITAPDFLNNRETSKAYLGRGLRDPCWFYWQLKQAVLQNWGAYTQRYAGGIRVAYFESGNPTSLAVMRNNAANLNGDVTVLVPDNGQGTRRTNDIEVREASAASADTFSTLIRELEKKLKELIASQTATSEATTTGIGSAIGAAHERTKATNTQYACQCIAEAISADMIRVITRMNKGEAFPAPKFRFMTERPEPEQYMKAVAMATQLGLPVPLNEVYRNLGIRTPDPDEEVIVGLRASPISWTDATQDPLAGNPALAQTAVKGGGGEKKPTTGKTGKKHTPKGKLLPRMPSAKA